MHEMLIAAMAAFAVLGAVDRIAGNRFGLGKEFEEGILAMGSLAMAMLGIITLAPVLAALLRPVVVPVFSFLGADPAMFAGTILACDMGGGALAQQLTENPDAAILGGNQPLLAAICKADAPVLHLPPPGSQAGRQRPVTWCFRQPRLIGDHRFS